MNGPSTVLLNALKPHTGWRERLDDQFRAPYFQQLAEFIAAAEVSGKIIFPSRENCFNALNSTAFDQVKVVVLGQDPYHGDGQAHGLCFSVMPGVTIPPSLVNIYKEINDDLGILPPDHGYLQSWADQGVLLLNSVLTVESGKAGAHQGQGWETFTDHIVALLNEQREGLVFLLWGAYAQKKGALIDRQKHCVLESTHPSPLSAYRGFLGCRHFSAANRFLVERGEAPIDWSLPKHAVAARL